MFMKTADRKAAITAYKERKVEAGVFALRCKATGEVWVGQAVDLGTIRNRLWFTLGHGSHPVRTLQTAWNAQGGESFMFEELERIAADQPAYARDAALQDRLGHWLAELKATGI
jgi:hypothetical protein